MKPEIIEFYTARHLQISKQIDRRPPNLSEGQIEEAAVRFYGMIEETVVADTWSDSYVMLRNGDKVRTINTYNYIKDIAAQVKGEQYAKDRELINTSKEIIAEKDNKYKRLAILTFIAITLGIIETMLRLL